MVRNTNIQTTLHNYLDLTKESVEWIQHRGETGWRDPGEDLHDHTGGGYRKHSKGGRCHRLWPQYERSRSVYISQTVKLTSTKIINFWKILPFFLFAGT
jgi:hypothetical protein